MSASTTVPPRASQTHPCARCGAPVALDVGLCERCNPLGLRDSSSSQVHGTVFLGIGLAVAGLAIAAHLAVAGIGPFSARVTAVTAGAAAGRVVATIEIRNDGRAAGRATCRITDPRDAALANGELAYSPTVAAGQSLTFEQDLGFGTPGRPLSVVCTGP